MVDVSPARAEGRAGVLVPIEEIERERKGRNVGIFAFGTFCRVQEKLAFARQEICTEGFGKIGRNVTLPVFAADSEFDRSRINLLGRGIR